MADLRALKKQRSANKGKLTLIINSLSKGTDMVVEECRAKLARVEKLMEEFTAIENRIFELDQALEIDQDYEENYYFAITELNKQIRRMGLQTAANNATMEDVCNTTQGRTDIKLPKLNIPVFSGDYTEWQSFHDLYVSSIHDSTTLSPVQKLQYLKGLLRGEAASLLRHFSITEANYIEALQKLRQRYDRKRYTMNAFIHNFIEQPSINVPNTINIKRLLDTSDEILRGLKAMGPHCEERDPWLVYILTNKLDHESKNLWAQETANKEFPTIAELFNFLLRRSDALESLRMNTKRNSYSPNKPTTIKSHVVVQSIQCPICQTEGHLIHQCKLFNEMSIDKRREWVKTNNRCFNCLSDKHPVYRCPSKRRCLICKGRHHTLVHLPSAAFSETSDQSLIQSTNTVLTCSVPNTESQSVLPTARTEVLDSSGQAISCRALLDSGSQASFITESLLQRLGIPRQNGRFLVTGVGQIDASATKGTAFINIKSQFGPILTIKVFILKRIAKLSQININPSLLSDYNLPLADPEFYKAGEIDLLIGVDQFFNILLDGQIKTSRTYPALQNTIFGWIVAGNITNAETVGDSGLCGACTVHEFNIDQTLKRFWELESIPNDYSVLSPEEELCENHFKQNVQRCQDGRFCVRLPFKTSPTTLSGSLGMAIQRFRGIDRRFIRDKDFHDQYKGFMHEYLNLGHMQEIPPAQIKDDGFFLPHHGIFKNHNSTTKIRVVFDGSAKTSSGVSLNDCLAVGPTIQATLYAIILRFREHRIIFCADIEKMYRQIRLHDDDTQFQKIVWREDSTQPLRYFKLQTVTYGLASSSYLATRALKEIAEDIRKINPIASPVIERSIYIDDIMTGGDTLDEVTQLKQSLTSTLSKYGFILRKWVSNSERILGDIPISDRQLNSKPIEDSSTDPSVKILGLQYDPCRDVFQFRVALPTSSNLTKRVILSEAGKLFDPLGWLAPVNIKIKIFIQQLWLLNLNWDDPLPNKETQEWKSIREVLPTIEEISIPRFVNTTKGSSVELHGFCDASTLAFAAVIYYKVTTESGNIYTNLISAKTKVAPLKQQSLPRLELCGAVLLVKLMNIVTSETNMSVNQIYLWTDSTVVLDWLTTHPRRWPTFIANRTSEILSSFSRQHWRHVPSTQNPADCASRGVYAHNLKSNLLWWNGPNWLSSPQESWPEQQKHYSNFVPTVEIAINTVTVETNVLETLVKRCSSFHKLQRIVAYCLRFIVTTRKLKQPAYSKRFLTRNELHDALSAICRYDQSVYFNQEIDDIVKSRPTRTSSNLKSLSPYMDESRVLRVGGRLDKSELPFATKHPIILSANSDVTRLIMEELHRINKHAGPSLLLALSRQKFWIPGARNLIRKIIHGCIPCTRQMAIRSTQLMGNLPRVRLELVRPFLKVGVDFAGPLSIHLTRGRGQKTWKAYICLFICLSVKAVHIELVGDLSSEAFLAALRRFIARRGCCQDIYSDNGSNFVGANNQLQRTIQQLIENSNEISHFISRNNINWHFIPPNAPHFGGIWESAIKSAKYHLRRVLGDSILTMEEMTTLLTEIESILNCRPLCVLSADEIDALTPSHFLIGQPGTSMPETDISQLKTSYLSRWQMLQFMKQHFWKRWRLEYLTSLQQRNKWLNRQPSVNLNDLAVISEDNVPVNKWLLGRISQLHPGSDGITRVVTLKTKNGELKRPIQKIVILPIEPDASRPAECSAPVQDTRDSTQNEE